jgi:type VI secretion system protein ImpF
MAELTPKERLQPALLDRLTDDDPGNQQETADKRVLTMRQLRRSVLRDLEWLFNTGNLATSQDLRPYSHVSRSVVNYGIPDLSGKAVSQMNTRDLEAMLRQAILDFEPRILPNSVRVRAIISADQMSRNAIAFEIEGDLWAQPVNTRLLVKTDIDFESGQVSIRDAAGSLGG